VHNRFFTLTAAARAGATALVAIAALTGCGAPEGAPGQGMPPAEVNVIKVEPKDVPVVFQYAAQTAGSRNVEVRARVNGILLKRHYEEGAPVKRGQLLFSIDAAPFEAAAARAEADLAAAQARANQAARNRARMEPLHEAKAVSQKEYDDAIAAEAIGVADAKAAKARLDEARLQLQYTRIESPINGVAAQAQKSEGSLISGPDILLTNVTQSDPIYVNFGISENEQMKIRRDIEQKRLIIPKDWHFDVTVKLADGSAYARTGKLTFNDVSLSGATGTSDARAELPNPNGALRPGQFVRVELKGARRPNAVLVPQRAVLEGPQGKFVYVVGAEGKAEARPIEVGEWSSDSWIVTDGLKAGDQVIVDNLMKLGPGAPVQIAGAAPSADAPAPPQKDAPPQKEGK
jgi:membrane fusion protein, multidrug efflux system